MAGFIEDSTACRRLRPKPIARLSPHRTEGARNTVGDRFSRSSRLISPAGIRIAYRSVRRTCQQARIYLADLPRQVRGEVDLMRADILPPESLASMRATCT
jgi:hypothetical protein